MKNKVNCAFTAKKKKLYNNPIVEVEALFGTGIIMSSPALPIPPIGPGAPSRRYVQVF